MGALVRELFRVELYKRSQGRIARQATFAALAIIVGLGAWGLFEQQLPNTWDEYLANLTNDYSNLEPPQEPPSWPYTIGTVFRPLLVVLPLMVLLGGIWASFRVVQMPTFADFLISVESEMSKVSWPSRGELFRASIVVMLVIFVLAGVLYGFDVMWKQLLGWLFRK